MTTDKSKTSTWSNEIGWALRILFLFGSGAAVVIGVSYAISATYTAESIAQAKCAKAGNEVISLAVNRWECRRPK